MIRHSIIIDTDYKTGLTKNPYKDAKSRQRALSQQHSIYGDGVLKSVKSLNKRAYVGYLFIKCEMLLLVLFAAALLFGRVENLKSMWTPSAIALGLGLVLWAIGRLPHPIKMKCKLVYFRIHILLFTGVLGSGGYLMAKELIVSNSTLTILIAALSTVFSLVIHLPFVKKENILKF